MSLDRIKDRIRKLLNVTEDDAATDGEIENAMRAALSLMAAHRLSEDDIRNMPDETGPKPVQFARDVAWCETSRMTNWETDLAWFCCQFLGTVQWYYCSRMPRTTPAGINMRDEKGKPIRQCRLTFYGPDEDVLLCVELFNELEATILSMGRLRYGGVFRGDGRAYAEGFVSGLNTHLKKVSQQLIGNDNQSRALTVRVNQIVAATVKDASTWLKESAGIRLGKGVARHSNYNDPNAWGRGRTDGQATSVSADRKRKLSSQ